MTVHQLPPVSLEDIPARLRRLADAIERGEHGEVPAAIVVLELAERGGFGGVTFGFGRAADPIRSAGLLVFGLNGVLHPGP